MTSTQHGAPTSRPTRSLLALAGVLALGLVGILFLLLGDTGSGGDGGEGAGNDVLAMPFTNDDGSTGTLSELTGQPVVINFFAAWCASCRAEIPEIEAVHQAAGDRVRVIGMSHDLDETSWRSFVSETGLTYPTVFQPEQEIYTSLGLFAMPATILLDPDGEMVHAHAGPLDAELLSQLVGKHLGVDLEGVEA